MLSSMSRRRMSAWRSMWATSKHVRHSSAALPYASCATSAITSTSIPPLQTYFMNHEVVFSNQCALILLCNFN
jgi:hypothetical protein